MSWITDENGFGRQSRYVDLASRPPPLIKRKLRYAAELHRFQGQLCLVLTAKEREFLDCGNSVTYGVIDQVNAVVSFGVQVGVARSWSKERTFTSRPCSSCVPILRLTDATLTETAYYGALRKKHIATVRKLEQAPDCERHYQVDCVPGPECPGCTDTQLVEPRTLTTVLDVEHGGVQPTLTLTVESTEREPADVEALIEQSGASLEDMLDFEAIEVADGIYVYEPWAGLIFLPRDIDTAPPTSLPVVPISIGRDAELLGGLLVEPGDRFPIALLATRSPSLAGAVWFTHREDTTASSRLSETMGLETTTIGPFSVLAATVAREEYTDGPPQDLVIEVADTTNGRSRTIRLPVRDAAEELMPVP